MRRGSNVTSFCCSLLLRPTHPVRHEREGAVGVASYYYLQASRLLLQAVDLGASQPELKERAVQYRERGELLVAREAGAAGVTSMAQQAPGTSELGRAYRSVDQGEPHLICCQFGRGSP